MICFFENFGLRIEYTFMKAGFVADHNSCKGTITLYQFNNFAKKQIFIAALWMNNIEQIHIFKGALVFSFQEQERHSLSRCSILEKATGTGQSSAGKKLCVGFVQETLELPFQCDVARMELAWFSFYSRSLLPVFAKVA